MYFKRCYIMTISALLFSICECQSIYNASDLIDDLLANYKTVLRPKINQSEAVCVNISFELMSIIEFDEVQGSLFLNAFLVLQWIDERLVWDPTNYNGLSDLMIESYNVWTPMIVLLNTIKKTEKVGSDDPWQLIRFSSDGKGFYYPGGLFSSSCDADVTNFPFDSHTCSVEFVNWGLSTNELNFLLTHNEVQLSYFSPNLIWELKETSAYPKDSKTKAIFELTLKRKPMFVISNIILPIVLLTFLNTVVFLIPIDSGERISYSITMLLAVAVFLTMVGDNLPKISSPMSIFSYYLLLILVLCVLFGTTNVISLRCYFADEQERINNYWRKIIVISRFKLPMKCRSKAVHAETPEEKEKRGSVEDTENPNVHLPTKVIKRRLAFVSQDENKDIDNISWKDISCALDRVSFVVSLSLTICITLTCFVVIYVGSYA